MVDDDDKIKVGSKVRVLIVFESREDAMSAYCILRAAREEKQLPPDAFVYPSILRESFLFVENETRSMLAQWLANLKTDLVRNPFVLYSWTFPLFFCLCFAGCNCFWYFFLCFRI